MKAFANRWSASLLSCSALVAVFSLSSTSAPPLAATAWANLTTLSLPVAGSITSATEKTAPFTTTVATNSAPTFTVPGPFPFCLVEATLTPTSDSQINIEVWLPSAAHWNGKYVGLGNGGLTGAIRHASMVRPMWSGYAVANSDLGHPGGTADFALGHPEKVIDYAYRGDHVTAQA